MKRRTGVILAGLAVILGAFAAASPAHAVTAQPPPAYNICFDQSSGPQCMNNWGGHASDGNPVNFYPRSSAGEPNNDWSFEVAGYVIGQNCSGPGQPACWPFATGSGMNATYNNKVVYILHWAPNLGYCADQYNYFSNYGSNIHSGTVRLYSCTGSSAQLFVSTSSRWFVAVQPSNIEYQNWSPPYQKYYPVWMGGSSGTNQGNSVGLAAFNAGSWSVYVPIAYGP